VVAYSVATKKGKIERCKKIQKKHESSFGSSLSSMVNALTFAVVVVGVLYVAQTNRLATMGYEIKEKENEINTLFKDNEALKINAAELKSMHHLELKKEEMKLRKPQEIGYLEIDDSVAMGR
jgi:hypothetical protein